MRSGGLLLAMCIAALASAPVAGQVNGHYEMDVRGQRLNPDNAVYFRDWRTYQKYDYDRPEQGRSVYFANDYYRDWRYYQSRPLDRNDRIYRGSNGGYYCRRPDGTTGLVHVPGASLSNALHNGESAPLGTVVATLGVAKVDWQIDRQRVLCR